MPYIVTAPSLPFIARRVKPGVEGFATASSQGFAAEASRTNSTSPWIIGGPAPGLADLLNIPPRNRHERRRAAARARRGRRC